MPAEQNYFSFRLRVVNNCLIGLSIFLLFAFFSKPVKADSISIGDFGLSAKCIFKTTSYDNCLDGSPKVVITWRALNDSTCNGKCYYWIYRKENVTGSNDVPIATNLTKEGENGQIVSYLDVGGGAFPLKESTSYTYRIKAWDASGPYEAGEPFAESLLKPIDTLNCSCPNPFSLKEPAVVNNCEETTNSTITITWPEVYTTNHTGSPISIKVTDYEIYRWEGTSPPANDPFNSIYRLKTFNRNESQYYDDIKYCDGSNCSYKDKITDPNDYGKIYTYKAVAFSFGAGKSSKNALAEVVAWCPKPVISAPTGSCSPNQISVNWQDCEGSSDLLSCLGSRGGYYYVYRNSDSVIHTQLLRANNCVEASCTLVDQKDVKNNTEYTYKIKAWGSGWTLMSEKSTGVTLACTQDVVSPPTNLTVDPYCDNTEGNQPEIFLRWEHSNPTSIRKYYIYKKNCTSLTNCGPWVNAGWSGQSDLFYIDENITKNEYYSYQIVAESINGQLSNPNSDSPVVQAEDCADPPLPPQDPTVTVTSDCFNLKPRMKLSWGQDANTNVYYIFKNFNEQTSIANTTDNYYNDAVDINEGQAYYYKVEARGDGGGIMSDWTLPVTAKVDCNKPGAFKLAKPTQSCPGGNQRINLSWAVSANADNYDVFRNTTNTKPDCATEGYIGSTSGITFPDSVNLQEGATYYYFIRAEITGQDTCTIASSPNGNSITVSQLTAPTGLTATPSCFGSQSIINLSWNSANGASSYTVCPRTDSQTIQESDCTLLAGSGTAYTHNNLSANQTYYYKVRAEGCGSMMSAPSSATANCCPPDNFSISSGTAACDNNNPVYTISWAPPGGSVEKYDIYRGTQVFLNVTSPYTDNSAGAGTFSYYVKAKAACGEKYTNSNTYPITGKDCADPTIAGLGATAISCINNQPAIRLSWNADHANSYEIYRCKVANDCQNCSCATTSVSSNITVKTYEDRGLSSGYIYFYKVKAINSNNNHSAFSGTASTETSYCPPGPFTATLTSGCNTTTNKPSFTINWTQAGLPANIEKYEVFRANGKVSSHTETSPIATLSGISGVTTHTDSATENETWYSYYIKAIGKGGESDVSYSNFLYAYKDCQGPAGVVNDLAATTNCDATTKNPYIYLVWSINNNNDVHNYQIYRDGQLLTTTVGSFPLLYQDNNVTSGTNYIYYVVPCDVGGLCGAQSNNDGVRAQYCRPDAPANLQATTRCVKPGSSWVPLVSLSWNQAKNATGYKIIRNNPPPIQTTTAFSYDDTSPNPETNYNYKVIAYNTDFPCAGNDCDVTSCSGQCSFVNATTTSCVLSVPKIHAERVCAEDPLAEGLPNNFGTYTDIWWEADESIDGAPLWCKIEKTKQAGEALSPSITLSPTFYSHAESLTMDTSSCTPTCSTGCGGYLSNSSYYNRNLSETTIQKWCCNRLTGCSGDNNVKLSSTRKYGAKAVHINNALNYINIKNNALPQINQAGGVTLDLWFKPTICANNYFRTVLVKNSSDVNNPVFRLAFNYDFNGAAPANSLTMTNTLMDYNGSNGVVLKSNLGCSGAADTKFFHHFIFTQDYNTNYTEVYLDNELVYTSQGNPFQLGNFQPNNSLYLGCSNGSTDCVSDKHSSPLFDEIRIWPEKMTEKQIAKLEFNGKSTFTNVSSGSNHTCALLSDGTVNCWGLNSLGQLGDGTTTQRVDPVQVLNLNKVTAIATGGYYTCALINNSGATSVWCWGHNNFGQLGNGNITNSSSPVQVLVSSGVPLTGVKAISTGGYHTCAVLDNNTIKCWGKDMQGQLGNGTMDSNPHSYPIQVPSFTDVKSISTGMNHTCAVKNNNTAYCWGVGGSQQLGNGYNADKSTPQQVKKSSINSNQACQNSANYLEEVESIDAGTSHTCAVVNSGGSKTAYCWGLNSKGPIGDGNSGAASYTMCATQQVLTSAGGPVLSGVESITVGGGNNADTGPGHTCAVVNSGGSRTVWCWGSNSYGQLGNGATDTNAHPYPIQVLTSAGGSALTDAESISISAGYIFYNCARLSNNTIWCWGYNSYGQLGNGGISDSNKPLPVISPSLKLYDTYYDDFNAKLGGNYTYKVTCKYSTAGEISSTAEFDKTDIHWCKPEIDFLANDLQQVCSDVAADSSIADCSGAGYTPLNADLDPAPQAPYVLLNWRSDAGVEKFEIWRYKHGDSEDTAVLLKSLTVNPADLSNPRINTNDMKCPNNNCSCRDRSAEQKNQDDAYDKYHYFIKAISQEVAIPPVEVEKDFPSSASSGPGFGLNCSPVPNPGTVYLLDSCTNNQPGVDIFLKEHNNITSYWDGNIGHNLFIAGGQSGISNNGISSAAGIGGDEGGASQLASVSAQKSWNTVSWNALNNISSPENENTPVALSMWVKFNSLPTSDGNEILFYASAPTDIYINSSHTTPDSYLKLERVGNFAPDAGKLRLSYKQAAGSPSIDIYTTNYTINKICSSHPNQSCAASSECPDFATGEACIADTNWHHLKATWHKDGSERKMNLWLDFKDINPVGFSDSAPFPEITNYKVYLGDHFADSGSSPSSNTITAKAQIDDVWLTNTYQNDPYYYEIYRKKSDDVNADYTKIVTLDSNAYFWEENNLIADNEYSYKVRVVSTDNSQASLILSPQGPTGKCLNDNTKTCTESADCPNSSCDFSNRIKVGDKCQQAPIDLNALSSTCSIDGQPIVSLTWKDAKKPSIGNDYVLNVTLPDKSSQQVNVSSNSNDGYCGYDAEHLYACKYDYVAGSNQADYDFLVYRLAEADEATEKIDAGDPIDSNSVLVKTAHCFPSPPTPFSILLPLESCCANEEGGCSSSGKTPAIKLKWSNSDYTNFYEVYRCAGELCDSDSDFKKELNLVKVVSDSFTCSNDENIPCNTDSDCSSVGGTCGPSNYEIVDGNIEPGTTYYYRVFAYGNEVIRDDSASPKSQTAPAYGAEDGQCKLTPSRPILTKIKRSCVNIKKCDSGANQNLECAYNSDCLLPGLCVESLYPIHKITWDYASKYGQEAALHGDPNPNISIEQWLVYFQQDGTTSGTSHSIPAPTIPAPPHTVQPISDYNISNAFPLTEGHFYNYTIKAVTTADLGNIESEESFLVPSNTTIAPFCTNPPALNILGFGVKNYNSCDKIILRFTAQQNDLAEGYEIYRLESSPENLPKFDYSNCSYNENDILSCEYSTWTCDDDPPDPKCQNKKLNNVASDSDHQIKLNFQAKGPAEYTYEDDDILPSHTYYWAVVPYNSMGYFESNNDNIIKVDTAACAQASNAQAAVTTSLCPSTVILTWPNPAVCSNDASIHCNDDAPCLAGGGVCQSAVDSYQIYRKKIEENEFSRVDNNIEAGGIEACQGSGCQNKFTDALNASLTDIYKYRIVSVSKQNIEGTIFYIKGEFIEKNARACFKLPRWQELPGISP